MTDELRIKLDQATERLLYLSEYDPRLEPFIWGKEENSEPQIRQLTKQKADSYCQRVGSDQFFRGSKGHRRIP